MKMRKKLAAVLAAAMIASMMPMSAFAASDNRLNKTVKVEQDSWLTTSQGVQLIIDLKKEGIDNIPAGHSFYVELTDGEWASQSVLDAEIARLLTIMNAVSQDMSPNFSLDRVSDTRIAVVANTVLNKDAGSIIIPMLAQITGEEPTVEILPYDTAVTAGKFPLAISSTGNAIVTVDKVPTIANNSTVGTILLEEPFIGAFTNANYTGLRTLEVQLRDTDFTMTNTPLLEGTGAYTGTDITGRVVGDKIVYTISAADDVLLKGKSQRGGFKIAGLTIRPERDAREGEIKLGLSGNLVNKQQVVVAKYGDYTTSLKVAKKDYAVVAGQEIDVKFTLSEDMKNAIISDRKTSFEFTKDIVVHDVAITTKNAASSINFAHVYDRDDKKTNVFEVDDLSPNVANAAKNNLASYEFVATLYVPAGFTGDISLTASGKAFIDELEAVVAKTEAPVTVEGTGTVLKVGVQKQVTDAKIVIKETAKDRLAQKNLVISIADKDTGIQITGADVTVIGGDLELDKINAKTGNGTIIIPVKRYSTEPSTIEISNIQFNVDRTVPEGSYDVKVTGTALSDLQTAMKSPLTALHTISSEVAKLKDFIVIGTPNTEDIAGGASKAKVSFVIGASQYLVNGEEQTMDATAYAKDGRTMVPVRYVAAALGITGDKVVWDGPNQTVTIIADKTIQVKLGSKMMLIDGVSVPMSAAAEAVSGRVFVPVAEIARGLGVSVTWDTATQTATFN